MAKKCNQRNCVKNAQKAENWRKTAGRKIRELMKECAKNWNFHLLVMGRDGVRNHLNQAAVHSTW